MMSNKGRRLIPTPDWFDLAKYQVGTSFPLLDWALNLIVRAHVNWLLDRHKCDEAREWFDKIRENGFLNRNFTEPFYTEAKGDYGAEKYKPGYGIVYSLPLRRAIEISDFIQSDTELRHKLAIVEDRRFNRKNEAVLFADCGESGAEKWYREVLPELRYDDFYDDFGSFSPHVCVDLEAPDDTVIDAFKDWLKATRASTQSDVDDLPEKISDTLIKRWGKTRVLPYLDLKIWERLEGVDLPLHKVGDVIFQDDASIDTTEAVRKTTRVNANKALMQRHAILRHAIVEELRQCGKKIT